MGVNGAAPPLKPQLKPKRLPQRKWSNVFVLRPAPPPLLRLSPGWRRLRVPHGMKRLRVGKKGGGGEEIRGKGRGRRQHLEFASAPSIRVVVHRFAPLSIGLRRRPPIRAAGATKSK
jgi:hypothetical protein